MDRGGACSATGNFHARRGRFAGCWASAGCCGAGASLACFATGTISFLTFASNALAAFFMFSSASFALADIARVSFERRGAAFTAASTATGAVTGTSAAWALPRAPPLAPPRAPPRAPRLVPPRPAPPRSRRPEPRRPSAGVAPSAGAAATAAAATTAVGRFFCDITTFVVWAKMATDRLLYNIII